MASGVARVNLWKKREVPYLQTDSYSTGAGTLHSVHFRVTAATNMVLYAGTLDRKNAYPEKCAGVRGEPDERTLGGCDFADCIRIELIAAQLIVG